MANQIFKAALNFAVYPMTYAQASRSVMQPGMDVAAKFGGSASFGTMDSVDWNLIQCLYMENVLPIAKGMQTVGFSQEFAPASPPDTAFDQLIIIKDAANANAVFCPAAGKNYVYSDITSSWVSYAPFSFSEIGLVSKAYVQGRTLICYQQIKIVEWDPSVPTMQTRTLSLPTGYAIGDIRGNCGASNYHLLFTDVEILWSALDDILEFDDPDQGSGRQTPVDLKGTITAVLPIAGGFIIYGTENAVAGMFTNNAATPFAFREVQNSSGVASSEQVTGEANNVGHYAYGAAGIQLLNLQKAETTFPEAADFLVNRTLEQWDPVAKRVVSEILSQNLQPKLQYLASRYLFISYGRAVGKFEFCLVYDTVLQRWGKLRIDHVDVGALPLEALGTSYRYGALEGEYDDYEEEYLELTQPVGTVMALRQNFGFLQSDGTVMLLSMQDNQISTGGLIIFGHLQIIRSRFVTVNRAEFDGLLTASTPTITLLGSDNGYDRSGSYSMILTQSSPASAEYQSRYTAKNVDVAVEGSFALTNLILETMIHGKR